MITDVYTDRPVVISGRTVKAGTPVLYFKANTAYPDLGNADNAAKRAKYGYTWFSQNYL